MERNCPNKGTVDATNAHTRHGANVCSLCLPGDDSGEATLEEVEEKFGGVEEVRGFVNAVRAQSEIIMTAVVLLPCSKVVALLTLLGLSSLTY